MRPFNTALSDQFQALGAPRPCYKQGHATVGKAEAQLRSILREQERKPDRKQIQNISVYRCDHRACRARPWHVGHSPVPRRQR